MAMTTVWVRVADPQHGAAVQSFAALLSAMNSPYGTVKVIIRAGVVERGVVECGFTSAELDTLAEDAPED